MNSFKSNDDENPLHHVLHSLQIHLINLVFSQRETMNFFKSVQPSSDHPFHHALDNVQTHFSNFVQIRNPTMNFFKTIQPSSDHENINPLHHVWKNIVQPNFAQMFSSHPSPLWASSNVIDQLDNHSSNNTCRDDPERCKENLLEAKKRLNDIRVYRLTYLFPRDPVPLIVHQRPGVNPVLYFFSKREPDFLVETYKNAEGCGGIHLAKVSVAEAIDVELQEFANRPWLQDEIFARLVPDVSEVRNALKEREKAGIHGDSFSGIPVFQSESLRMIDRNSRGPFFKNSDYRRPAFFKKADLEKALSDVKEVNQREIQVFALEDIIQEMKDCSTSSKWKDVVFIPPGETSWRWEKILKMAAYVCLTFL